jgi:Flp pilus assembly protein TadD
MKHSRPKESQPHRPRRDTGHAPRVWLLGILVALVVLGVFANNLANGFNYDDDGNIQDNPHFRGLGPQQLAWMFSTFHLGHYQPLSWITLGLDYVLWGLNPVGYHLSNVLLHATNAVLVFLLARRLLRPRATDDTTVGGESWPLLVCSAIAALLFALHPLRVESVAWVTERRDVLSSFFLLLTVLLYLYAQTDVPDHRRRRWLLAAFGAYLFSLLSRAMGVTLPAILLLLDYWPLRRLGTSRTTSGPSASRVVLEKVPFAVLALGFAILAPLAQVTSQAAMTLEEFSLRDRLAQAGYGLVFYLWKTLLPLGLAPLYELREPLAVLSARYLVPAALAVLLAAFLLRYGRRWPWLAVTALVYAILLAPVLGFVQSGRQEVADRYSYLPMIGWMLLVGRGLQLLWERARPRTAAVACTAACGVVLVVLSVLTWRQSTIWRTPETLWSYAVRCAPGPTAHQNLAVIYAKTERLSDAISEYHAALALEPLHESSLYGLAFAYTRARQFEAALPIYETLLRYHGQDAKAHLQYARALREVGQSDAALREYTETARLDPHSTEARMNQALLLGDKGQLAAAAEVFREVVKMRPELVDPHYYLAGALAQLGQRDEAIAEFRAVLQLQPGHADAQRKLDMLQAQASPGH